jgi:hypothetical protein
MKTPRPRAADFFTTPTVSNTTTVAVTIKNIQVGGVTYVPPSPGNFTINIRQFGIGGLDNLPSAANTMYYVYAVPHPTPGFVTVIASQSANGPVGYPDYKLLGMFDTDSSGLVRAAHKHSLGNVGDIRHALMTEAQFLAENGPGWVLLDNRDIKGSKYHGQTGTPSLWDARGMIFRMKANGRSDGWQGEAGENTLGGYQDQAIVNHTHNTYDGYFAENPPGGGAPGSRRGRDFDNGPFNWYKSTSGINQVHRYGYWEGAAYNTGDELRMRNMTTNVFFKIN